MQIIGLEQKVRSLVITALLDDGVAQAQAEQIADANLATAVAQIEVFRGDHQDEVDIAGADVPNRSGPHELVGWQMAFEDLIVWTKANLTP